MNEVVVSIEDGYLVSYEHTDELKDRVFNRVMDYFQSHNAFIGEVICQDDECIIDAPNVMAEIADDIIKFKCTDV